MKKTILIAAVMFFAFTVAASAQALFQVGSTPVTTVSSCGTTELTGDVVFTQVVGSPTIQAGTITIYYGVPVTNTATTAPIVSVVDGAAPPLPPGTVTISYSGNQVLLTIPAPLPPASSGSYTIRVSQVRVNVVGTSLTSLDASVSSTVNSFVGGQTNVRVISAIASSLSSLSTTSPAFVATALNINGVSGTGTGTVNLYVGEGFSNAFVINQIIGFTFTAIPAGLTVTPALTATTTSTAPSGDTFVLCDANGVPSIAATALDSASTNLTVYYRMNTATVAGVTATETLVVPFAVATKITAAYPLTAGTVTVTADTYPKDVKNAFGFPNYSVVPQYSGTNCQKGPATILTINPGNTALLIPYATVSSSYDTGLAIANVTKDPLVSGVPQQTGLITFTFYPQSVSGTAGTPFSYTTSASSPGAGLTATGALAAGDTYAVLVSQLLSAAGKSTKFTGYIIAVVSATNCHGQFYVSDFLSFTNGAGMLVLNGPTRKTALPETLGN